MTTTEGAGPPPSATARSWAWGWLPPLMVFLAARALLMAAAAIGNHDAYQAEVWSRWDSNHYLSIAEQGYKLVTCASVGYAKTGWCGNAGWLPGYPMLVASFTHAGLTAVQAAGVLSAFFHLATLTLLWRAFLRGLPGGDGLVLLALGATFPGAVWQHAVFPISMFCFLALATLTLALRGGWLGAGACAAVGAFTYSTGFLLAPIGAAWALARRGVTWRRRLLDAVLIALPGALGFAAVLWVHHLATGAWDAFFRVQSKYGHGLHAPWATIAETLAGLGKTPLDPPRLFGPLQVAGTALGILTLVSAGLVRAARGRDAEARRTVWLAIYALVFWVFPLVMGAGVSLYRADALLMPAVLLATALPPAARATLLGLTLALTFQMGRLFFDGALP